MSDGSPYGTSRAVPSAAYQGGRKMYAVDQSPTKDLWQRFISRATWTRENTYPTGTKIWARQLLFTQCGTRWSLMVKPLRSILLEESNYCALIETCKTCQWRQSTDFFVIKNITDSVFVCRPVPSRFILHLSTSETISYLSNAVLRINQRITMMIRWTTVISKFKTPTRKIIQTDGNTKGRCKRN